MKQSISLDLVIKLAGALFVGGMLYANIQWTAKETQKDLETAKQQIEKRLERIEVYLDARHRNGL